jgi:hypothetical protein
MPGKATAVTGGSELRDKVAKLAADLGLEVRTEVKVGRRRRFRILQFFGLPA